MQQMYDKAKEWTGEYTKDKVKHLINGYLRRIQGEYESIIIPEDIVPCFVDFYFCDLMIIWWENT